MAKIKITQKRNNSTEIVISGELTIYCAMDTYQQYIQNITLKDLVTIKLSGVNEIDTAGMQLLILLIKEINQRKASYKIASSSNSIDEYATLFNLQHYFVDHEESISEAT